MKYGINILAQAAIRNERSETTELVTQMLFGETCKIVDQKDNWLFVYTDSDQYLGWVNDKSIKQIPHEIYQELTKTHHKVLSSAHGVISINKQQRIISQGSTILNSDLKEILPGIEEMTLIQGDTSKTESQATYAEQMLGTPYLWGGRTNMGIDCSGLIYNIFKIKDLLLPRDANQQVNLGKHIAFLSEAEKGDVCFFDNEDGKIIHTGILTNQNLIIHASGEVRIDRIDHQGIYNIDLKKYTHHLRTIKRML